MNALQKREAYLKVNNSSALRPLISGNASKNENLRKSPYKPKGQSKKNHRLNPEKIKELEVYYSMRRKSINTNDSPRRKLDLSMVEVFFPKEQNEAKNNKKNKKKSSSAISSKKRKLADIISKRDENYIKAKRNKVKNVLSAIVTITIVFIMLSTVLIRYAEISNQTYLNTKTEKEIQELEIELSKLDMDRALKEDLNSVQYAAASKGMTRPSADQVIFMAVNPELPDKYSEDNSAKDEEINQNNLTDNQSGNNSENNEKLQEKKGPIEILESFFSQIGKTLQGWLS